MSRPEQPLTPGESTARAATTTQTRRRLIAVCAVVVAAVGVVVALTWPHSSASHPASGIPVPAASDGTSAPAPTTSTSSAPTLPHDVVAAAAPTTFLYRGAGVDITAHVCGMLNVRPLDPPGEQHHTVCWVKEGFGVAPGTTSATTYILGHAWAEDDHEVLNQLSARAMTQVLKAKPVLMSGIKTYPVTNLNGDTVTLRTKRGSLVYTVRDAYAVSKSQAGYVQQLMDDKIAKRVVIITCGELHHRDYAYNIIVDAYLTASVAAPTTT